MLIVSPGPYLLSGIAASCDRGTPRLMSSVVRVLIMW